MPARPRKEIVDPNSPGYYLVTQRVVRGLRLTGVDPETGRDFTHRQRKLERRISELSGLHLIDVAEFNCGADGFDLLVRTRPDLLDDPALLLSATYLETKIVVDGEASSIEDARCCSASLRRQSLTAAAVQGTASVPTEIQELVRDGTSDAQNSGDARVTPESATQKPDAWLLPMGEAEGCGADSREGERFESRPYLRISYGEFRQLLQWTLERAKSRTRGRAPLGRESSTRLAVGSRSRRLSRRTRLVEDIARAWLRASRA